MNTRHLTIGFGLVLLLAGAGTSAEAKTQQVTCTFSGTFVSGETYIDTNGDGLSAGADQALENCNIGRFFTEEVSEYQAPLPAPETCPADTVELRLQQGHSVATKEKTGDQLFFELATNDATLCFNPSDFTFSVTAVGTVTGGTGEFAGATGSTEAQATGKFLVTGEKGGVSGVFGQFSGTSTWTLIFPDDDDDENDD